MPNHRTPRAHLQSAAIGEDTADRPTVSPALIEYLEREFPVTLSPATHPNNIISDQAEQRGRQQVIELLRSISRNED